MTLSKYININYMLNISITFFKQKKEATKKSHPLPIILAPQPHCTKVVQEYIYIYKGENKIHERA